MGLCNHAVKGSGIRRPQLYIFSDSYEYRVVALKETKIELGVS